MNNATQADDIDTNKTLPSSEETSGTILTMMIIHIIIASVGILGNFTVILAFLNHKKFRRKIPNIFILNQVSIMFLVHPLEKHRSLLRLDRV